MIDKDKEAIRNDLQKNTIDYVCRKYDLTFSELVNLLKNKCSDEFFGGYRYIYFVDGIFCIRRWQKDKLVSFGCYARLTDALKVRDYLMCNGWFKHRVKSICEELDVELVK